MGDLLSSILAGFAGMFSGAKDSECIVWHWDPVDCPKELQ